MRLVSLKSLPEEKRNLYLRQIVNFVLQYPEEFHVVDVNALALLIANILSQHTYLLLDDKGNLIGFVNFGRNRKNFPHINYLRAIGIFKPYQGKGIGEFLLEKFTSVIPKPLWIMVSAKNERMKRILEKLGFTAFLAQENYIAYLKES